MQETANHWYLSRRHPLVTAISAAAARLSPVFLNHKIAGEVCRVWVDPEIDSQRIAEVPPRYFSLQPEIPDER
jgi:hypothetical protein